MERFNFIFVVAGIGFFALAFVIMGALPLAQYQGIDVVTMDKLATNIPYQFGELARDYPDAFEKAFGTREPTAEAFKDALETGRRAYIAEACWHCHTQQIRRVDPNDGTEVGNDISRWASDTRLESHADEYHNAMNYPHLFGTRRVGPDLIRSSGRHSNDWHLAHFWNPRHTSPYSVMPPYPWFFEDGEGRIPNRKGLSLVTYMQWLGSWHTQFAPTKYERLPRLPFDESWYPPYVAEEAPAEGEADPYGAEEEDPY